MNPQHTRQFATWLRAVTFAAMLAAPAAIGADIGYQFVTVGNPGNAPDTTVMWIDGTTGYGSVNYVYDIGKYDVTLNQYTTFLNAVANTDPYGLYHASLDTDPYYFNVAGISRSGSSGSYTYSVIGDGNRPVVYITWTDAARFSNWLQNGQPTGLGEVAGSTEQGAYTLNGDTTSSLETRNANAQYWIPTESEWYKAAYYDPSLNSGAGGYWTYATKSNIAPGNNAQNPSLPNQANYYNGSVYSVTQSGSFSPFQNYLTAVGAFTNSASAYGTYDQNGDVFQWNDAVINGSSRGLRGGNWGAISGDIQSSYRYNFAPTTESFAIGFRIARISTTITAISRLANGQLVLQGRGFPNQNHTVTFSPDLVAPFASVGIVTAGSDGTFQFTDANAGSYSKGFYRVTFP